METTRARCGAVALRRQLGAANAKASGKAMAWLGYLEQRGQVAAAQGIGEEQGWAKVTEGAGWRARLRARCGSSAAQGRAVACAGVRDRANTSDHGGVPV